MERLPRQKCTKEFREEAVRLVLEQKLTTPEAARRLPMSDKTLANWVFRARQGQLAGLGETRRPVTELEAEVSRLKRELAEACMERDILKKATVVYVPFSGQGNPEDSHLKFDRYYTEIIAQDHPDLRGGGVQVGVEGDPVVEVLEQWDDGPQRWGIVWRGDSRYS